MKLSRACKVNYAEVVAESPWKMVAKMQNNSTNARVNPDIVGLTRLASVRILGIIIFTTTMSPNPQSKRQALQATGTFNPRANQVRHPLFQQSSFFDPEDLLQLKYETLRALDVDKCPIAQAARDFGLSRPTIYEAQAQFEQLGLEGLLPRKRGPKAAHKLTGEILHYLQEQAAAEPDAGAEELARRVRKRYAVKLHPRTIEKALKTKGKRGRAK
jgi:transposase